MYEIRTEFPTEELLNTGQALITIMQRTHPHSPSNQPDVVQFGNHLRTVRQMLPDEWDEEQRKRRMEPLEELRADKSFWRTVTEGLAVYAGPGYCLVYRLDRPVDDLVTAGTVFHLRPMLDYEQSMEPVQLLGLSLDGFKLYDSDGYRLEEVALPEGAARTMDEVLGREHTDSYLAHGSYGGGGRDNAMYHGHGAKKDERDKDVLRYFHHVDDTVRAMRKPNVAPALVLVGLAEHTGEFQKITKMENVFAQSIPVAYGDIERPETLERLRELLQPRLEQREQEVITRLHKAMKQNMASRDLEEIALATETANVEKMLIERGTAREGDLLDHWVVNAIKRNAAIQLVEEGAVGGNGVAALFRHA